MLKWTASVHKFMTRCILLIVVTAALTVIFVSIRTIGLDTKEAWATIAASLAVIASVLSAWTAQRALELQEKEQQPYPYPTIDVTSRYGLVQLRVTNFGGSPAHNIFVKWKKPLIDSKGYQVKFSKEEGTPDIPVLLPRDSAAVLIDGSIDFFQKNQDLMYSGHVEFENVSGEKSRLPFAMSAEQYRKSLTHDKEELKTHYELQKIPDAINALTKEVEKLKRALECFGKDQQGGAGNVG